MLSLSCASSCSSIPSAKALCFSSSFYLLHSSLRFPRVFRAFCSSTSPEDSVYDQSQEPHVVQRSNYSGVSLEETVEVGSEKSRLDSWISSRIVGVSRARVQSTIRSGLVKVNGRVVDKVSHVVRVGDEVDCTIMELKPLRADPEDIPLDIVYEDAHVLVVNKPADMVVHPAPGNASGTLVNGILHHCSLPTVRFQDSKTFSETEDSSDDEFGSFSSAQSSEEEMSATEYAASVRPGIVHRLDKGTSGLLVVAKDEHSHAHLSAQFKLHTIHRVYLSLTSGIPSPLSGRIEIPIGRDSNNRLRMAAIPGASKSKQARHAASRYRVIEVLAGGASALVKWSLETGRTHQIRAHAKFLGIPLLGDEVYGGTKSMALSLLRPKTPSSLRGDLSQVVSKLRRPCLHALALGFEHPHTGENMQFTCPPPDDFAEVLSLLRSIGTQKPAMHK